MKISNQALIISVSDYNYEKGTGRLGMIVANVNVKKTNQFARVFQIAKTTKRYRTFKKNYKRAMKMLHESTWIKNES